MNTLKHKYLCDKGRSNIVKKKYVRIKNLFLKIGPNTSYK